MFEAGPAFCSLNGTVTECIGAAEIALEWNGFASCIERKGDKEPMRKNEIKIISYAHEIIQFG